MKNVKRILGVLLAVCTVVLLFGCGKSKAEESKIETNNNLAFSQELNNKSDKGTYSIESRMDEKGDLIKFTDNIFQKEIVLCNKPGCVHGDDSCNAFVPNAKCSGDLKMRPIAFSSEIYVNGDTLYVIDRFGAVTAMKLDGTEHRKVMNIDGKYQIGEFVSYKGRLYAEANYLKPYDKSSDREFTDKDYNLALLELDLKSGAYKELFAFENEPETSFLGIYKDKAYFSFRDSNKMLESYTQEAIDYEENRHVVKLYYYDINTGEKTFIEENTKSHCMDKIVFYQNSVLYQNRKDKTFMKLNLDTNEHETLIFGFDKYIDYRVTAPIYDNKLFFNVNYDMMVDESSKPNETYYIDLATKELKKAGYKYTDSLGEENCTLSIVSEKENSFIIETDKIYEISKQDLYNNNFDNKVFIKEKDNVSKQGEVVAGA